MIMFCFHPVFGLCIGFKLFELGEGGLHRFDHVGDGVEGFPIPGITAEVEEVEGGDVLGVGGAEDGHLIAEGKEGEELGFEEV